MKKALQAIFLTMITLGSSLFLAGTLPATEMQGGNFRITRDDVNASGEVLQGGTFLVASSVGGIETLPLTGTGFRVQSGLQNIYFYPETITDVAHVPVSNTQIDITWTAPKGELPPVDLGVPANYPPAHSYVVKYSSITPLDNQVAFAAANTASQALTPQTPGALESLSIPSLSANTSYYISIESLDGKAGLTPPVDRNGSYFSTPATTWTLCNTPGPLDFPGFSPSSIQLRWSTNNNRPDLTVTYDAQVVTDTNTLANLQTRQTATAVAGLATINFTGMSQGIDYHFRVLARNGAGVPSPWSVWVATRIPVGLPFAEPFTGHDVDRFTANWLPNDGMTRPPWNALDPSFQSEADTDPAYNGPMLQPAVPSQTLSATYLGLQPNTTYFAHVRAFPFGGGQPSAYSDLGWTMTGVHATQAGAYVAHVDSASFTWSAPPAANGSNRYFYRVEMSTAADFTGVVFSSRVATTDAAPRLWADVTGLTPNTVYHARVITLNGIDIPSAQGPLNLAPRATRAVDPLAVGYTLVDDYRVAVSWLHNGNNPTQTRYQVDISSDATGLFGFLSATSDTVRGASTHAFAVPLQLLANTTYFARVRALGDSGTPSNYASFGSTVTRPTAATNIAFSGLSPTAITVGWSNVNLPNAQNNLGNGTVYRVELRDVVSEPLADQSGATTGLSRTFNAGLISNTTYHFRIYTQSSGNVWPEAGPLTGSTVTLALPPSAPAGFSGVTASALTVSWSAGLNPPNTRFRVDVSTDAAFGVVNATAEGVDLFTQPFNGLLANTTYYARAWGINHAGAVSATSLFIGSTVTLVNTPVFDSFQVGATSITVLMDVQGNAPDTTYHVRDLNAPTQNYFTMLNPADATHPLPWHSVTGLPVNSLRDFRISALNRAGSETPDVAASTWTHAASDAVLVIGNNQPWFLDVTLNPGSNPTVSPATQFAIQLEAVIPDGFPTLTGRYFGTDAGLSGGRRIFLADAVAPVWRNLSQWNNGVMISSGLATGRTYFFRVLARNGDDGAPPRVVTSCQLSFGQTKSYIPVLFLKDVDAYNSIDNAVDPGSVWHNSLDVPFIALGAFNNNFQMKSCATSACQNPDITLLNHAVAGPPGPFTGWNGRYDAAAPVHTAVPAPIQNYTGALSGIRVPFEGRHKVHIIGDSYPYIPAGTDPTLGHYTDHLPGPSYTVFIDTTPPNAAAFNLRALRRPGDTVPIPSGQQVGWDRPYFRWNDPDAGFPGPAFTISPTVGYSYIWTTNAGANPLASSDTVRNTNTEGFLAATANPGFQIAPPIVAAGVYYFKVMSLDKAGNWSAVGTYTYDVVPDTTPPVPFVDFGPSIRVAANNTTVAVSTMGVITVTFSDRMNPNQTDGAAFQIQLLRDNRNIAPAAPTFVPMNVAYTAYLSSSVAVLTPQSGVLNSGCRYRIASTSRLEDESGNVVSPAINEDFHTLMDPAVDNTVSVDVSATPVSVVTFPANSWNGGLAGLAINQDPANQPLAAPALAGLIRQANDRINRNARGYGRPLAVHEFNLYNPAALRLGGMFNQPVRLTMRYNDADGDGIVDETEGTPAPVRVSALAIYWLDEDTGVWVRLPGSQVDTVARTVTVDVRHFSVYGILGAPDPSLANAYAYPVPYKPAIHPNGIRFAGLSSVATIKVFTVNGDLVKTLQETDGDGVLIWNPVVNDSGDPVASDVYLYLIESDQQKKTGKLLVVR